MCVIAAKPANVSMPSAETIEDMWFTNPDGAGFMYAHNGCVTIEKGFMKLSEFQAALNNLAKTLDLTATPLVMHFRIATHGGVSATNTHPFPVTDSTGILSKLRANTTLGVAHNGIISSVSPRKGWSDTLEYVATQLAPLYKGVPKFLDNPHLMKMVSNSVGSKLAFLTSAGEIRTVGKFEEDGGILYSNTYFKWEKFPATKCYGDGKWLDYDWSDWGADNYKPKLVEWLWGAEEETRVISSSGRVLADYSLSSAEAPAEDYAVDTDGKVYMYDYDFAALVEVSGARAWTAAGLPKLADPDGASTCLEEVFSTKLIPEPVPLITAGTETKASSKAKGKRQG